MTQDALFRLLAQAQQLSGHADYTIIGSLSILGLEADFSIPPDMAMSVDVDCYTKDDPPKIFGLTQALGENSDYHQRFGYFLDAVGPDLASLPDGWQARLIKVQRQALRAWFLEPNDAAVSKYARGEPRDIRWIRAGLRAGVVSSAMVHRRMRETTFLDADEQQRAKSLAQADRDWFAQQGW